MKIVLLVLVAAASALLPDPPKVTVPAAVLRHIGITIDPNVPGLFDKLVKNATADALIEQMKDSHSHITIILDGEQFSISQLFTFLLESPVSEHAQFAIAHMVNIYYRLFNYTKSFNKGLTDALTKFHSSQNQSSEMHICKTNLFIYPIVRQYTLDVNPNSACRTFQNYLSKPLIIAKMISDVSYAQQSLDVQHTLIGGPVSIANVKLFMSTAPNLPTIFQPLYQKEMTFQFSDYIQFINKIETTNEGEKNMKELLVILKDALQQSLKNFWDLSRRLAE